MERVNLAVQKREGIGKGAARTNRRDGMIPAVMYKRDNQHRYVLAERR